MSEGKYTGVTIALLPFRSKALQRYIKINNILGFYGKRMTIKDSVESIINEFIDKEILFLSEKEEDVKMNKFYGCKYCGDLYPPNNIPDEKNLECECRKIGYMWEHETQALDVYVTSLKTPLIELSREWFNVLRKMSSFKRAQMMRVIPESILISSIVQVK